MAALMYACLTSDFDPRIEFLVTDLTHMPAYALLTFLLTKSLRTTITEHRTPLIAFFIAVAYGALIEFLQGFTGRQPSWTDVGLNTLGASIIIIFFKLRKKHLSGDQL